MRISRKLQITYIPPLYWNHQISGFELNTHTQKIPEDASFFVLWTLKKNSSKHLNGIISETFPNIPIDKLVNCKIRLAFPNSDEFFDLIEIEGKMVPTLPMVDLLFKLNIRAINEGEASEFYSNSFRTWTYLTKLLFELLNKGNYVPTLNPKSENLYFGKWRILVKDPYDEQRLKEIINKSDWISHNLPVDVMNEDGASKTSRLWHPSYLYSTFFERVGDSLIRYILKKQNFRHFKDYYSNEINKEKRRDFDLSWDYKFLKSIITKNSKFSIRQFHNSIIPIIVRNWTQITRVFTYNRGFSFTIELKYPKVNTEEWLLQFFLKQTENNVKVPITDIWKSPSNFKKEILKFFPSQEQFTEYLLRAFGIAAKIYPPIREALNHKIPQEIKLNSVEVMDFLRYPKDILIRSGFNVLLPEVFRTEGKHRLSAKMIIRKADKDKIIDKVSASAPSALSLQSIAEYEWKGILKGKELNDEEFKNIINSNEPLINWRGEWILIDHQDIEDLKEVLEKGKIKGNKHYMEALRLGLSGSIQLQEEGKEYDVVIEGDLNSIVNQIKTIERIEKIPSPSNFNGKLRDYQCEGYAWMVNMCALNFGLCLADDMGLGKTIQVIAYLLYLKNNYPKQEGSYLIVCPTSLLFNWSREIKKFAPQLEIMTHHGTERYTDPKDIQEFVKSHRVILTSFGTLRNDIKLLQTINFRGIIVDEIQNIKNYKSQQTQSVYKLNGEFRIGLSGTPIENQLMELWTIFEFLNPGLLGKMKHFKDNYAIPIERFQDQEAIEKLKKIIGPFILRRVKTDKSIIKDLPQKNEMKVYLDLSTEQRKIYQSLAEKAVKELGSSNPNKISIFNLLMKLKQICNHPYQFLHKPAPSFKNEEIINDFIDQSPKLQRLIEMVDEIISKTEKVLVFTQFTQMGDMIVKLLEEYFEDTILYFHGGVPEKRRKIIIDEFQSEKIGSAPIMVLSLKAGGIGLNLTQATTVFHFDRWWNPAVEDQATDRAYRIGQTSTVNVYKFITKGTIEEKIDLLLEEKRDLADKILESSGESWITDLNEKKLKELITLE
ncbi:MAG: hypothetical protein GF353_23455 [Candidatus Lokiarchaeota archaeon]|nr:hypothetical protein [Candidatus Lokiarchaeota archaeon]